MTGNGPRFKKIPQFGDFSLKFVCKGVQNLAPFGQL